MGKGINILLVDDDKDTLEFIAYNLTQEGFNVETAQDGLSGIEKAKSFNPNLIILDIMMPKMDGVEACRILRSDAQFDNTIITFLTARHEDYSQIAGFDAGADDYISKPIKPRLLLSKVKSLLRRAKVTDEKNIIHAGNIVVDKNQRLVFIDGESLFLPKKEFLLLALFASKPGRVFTREEILSKVWGTETIVVDRTIDVHVSKLREKIGEKHISTVKGVGYKYIT